MERACLSRVRRPWERRQVLTVPEGESLTEQAHGPAVDVNAIVSRFARTGQLPPARQEAVYADVTGLQRDLRERIEFAGRVLSEAERFLQERPGVEPATVSPAVPVEKSASE